MSGLCECSKAETMSQVESLYQNIYHHHQKITGTVEISKITEHVAEILVATG